MEKNNIRSRAATALTTAKHVSGFYFPMIYVCPNDFAFFRSAILNACPDESKIEEMTFEEAYLITHGKPVPYGIKVRINHTINQL